MQRILRAQHVVTTIRRASTRRTAPPAKYQPRQPNIKKAPSKPSPEPPKEARAVPSDTHKPSRPSEFSKEPKVPLTSLPRSQAIPWVLGSLVAGGIAFYLANLYVAATQPCSNRDVATLSAQKDLSARYDDTADSFDAEVGVSEMLMGINSLRKRLARQCKGHVLEVSCGTGRNLGYFDLRPGSEVESLTFVDLSPQMVEVCKRKWDVLVGEDKAVKEKDTLKGLTVPSGMKRSLVVRFLTGSALDAMPPPPETASKEGTGEVEPAKQKYTTILQTMGLCSTPSPHTLLASMISHLDTSDPDARVLLLEHGRSYQPWLNRVLDNSAEKHAEIHGCWFNRDIGEIVYEVAKEKGLEVSRVRRRHLGTTWVYELKAGPELLAAKKAKVQEEQIVHQEEAQSKTSGGWSAWLPSWK